MILYKVYDYRNKLWVNNIMLSDRGDLYEERKRFFGLCKYKLVSSSRYKLFRCTELSDKNHRLIYEGDILRITTDNGDVTGVISYAREVSSFILLDIATKQYHYLSEERCHTAVILGNMVENGDLILNTNKKENENE